MKPFALGAALYRRDLERKTMTAQELAAAKPDSRTFGLLAWASEAQATLLAQAQEIEALKADFCKQLDGVSTRNYTLRKENEAIKADAERYVWYTAQLASGNLDKLDEAFRHMERVEVVTKQMLDAAIDAMKGQS